VKCIAARRTRDRTMRCSWRLAASLLLLTVVATSPLRDEVFANYDDDITTTAIPEVGKADSENVATTTAQLLLPQIEVRMSPESSEDKSEKERAKKSDQLCYTVSFIISLLLLKHI
jgi:hypothetical protein